MTLRANTVTPVVVSVQPAAFRPKDAARYVGVGETTIRSLPIPPLRIFVTGSRKPIVLYLRAELDAWLLVEAEKRDSEIIGITTSKRAS